MFSGHIFMEGAYGFNYPTGDTFVRRFRFVFSGIGIQSKVSSQLNFPTCIVSALNQTYWRSSSPMLSITGVTTCSLPSAILPNRGSSHPIYRNRYFLLLSIFIYMWLPYKWLFLWFYLRYICSQSWRVKIKSHIIFMKIKRVI